MSGAVQHFEIYKSMSGGRVIRMSCECSIGRNHGYAEARAADARRAAERERRGTRLQHDGAVVLDAPPGVVRDLPHDAVGVLHMGVEHPAERA